MHSVFSLSMIGEWFAVPLSNYSSLGHSFWSREEQVSCNQAASTSCPPKENLSFLIPSFYEELEFPPFLNDSTFPEISISNKYESSKLS